MGTISSPPVGTNRSVGRPLFWLGIVLVVLGPVLLIAQFKAKILWAPWYVAILATVGVALLLVSLVRRVTVSRILALALCGLLTGGEWYFLLVLSKLPAYTGPVAVGVSFPPFHTTLADGSSFDQNGLPGEQNTALVFFRGRW